MKHDMTHAWHNLRLPPRNNNNNVNVNGAAVEPGAASGAKSEQFHEFYTLGPLLPDSSYEAKVSAKNVFGWSESSNIFQFYTQGKGKNRLFFSVKKAHKPSSTITDLDKLFLTWAQFNKNDKDEEVRRLRSALKFYNINHLFAFNYR
jgi:hypothetical protein